MTDETRSDASWRFPNLKVGDLIMVFFRDELIACSIATTTHPEGQGSYAPGLVLWSQTPGFVPGTKREVILSMDKTVLSPEEWLL